MPTATHDHHILDTDLPIFRSIDGVFSDLNLCEIGYSLEGKGEIPPKYLYFGNGINNWKIRSVNNKEELVSFNHANIGQEYELMNKTIDLVLGAVSDKNNINVVDIGPGTGYPAFPVLSFLQDKKKLGKYIAIDIVEEMCDLAIGNLKSTTLLNKMKTQKYVHDFEYGHFANLMFEERKEDSVNLFIFIGSTLSNMVDRHRALANIRDSMTEGDLLWVGILLYNSVNEIINFYSELEVNSPEYLKKCSYHASFFESFGMEKWTDYGQIVVEEFDDTGLIKYFFKVNKPFILEIPKNSKSNVKIQLKYQIGDKITVNRAKNYQDQDLVSEFREAGFKIKMLNVSDDYRYALILASV